MTTNVEPNDDLSPEKGVSGTDGGSNVAYMAQDSREKLEADVREHYAYSNTTLMYPPSANKSTDMLRALPVDTVIGWLDRQAAITEREMHGKIRTLQKQNEEHLRLIDSLTAERDELAEKLAESGELVNGGNAEDWYRCLEDMTHGKELIEKSLTAENKRLRTELEQAKAGLKHQKAMRKKAESLVKDGQALDMAELKEERDMWRERCGRMLDAAHELARIAEVDG